MRRSVVVMLVAALIAPALALSVAAPSTAVEERAAARQTLKYGSDPLQTVDYWPGASARAPLVLFVHGGGWKRGDKAMMDGSAKLTHWRGLGYAVASVNYRLVPEATVEQQAADVAAATALLKARAPTLGFDGTRIALVGHSAGAHLVALVGTDPAYLRTAGLDFGDIAGVVPLDGAAYDVPAQLAEGARIMHATYAQAFGTDPERQARLSPTKQAAAPNAGPFLILHVQRADGIRQSEALAAALRQSGTSAEVQGFAGAGLRGHAADQPPDGRPRLSGDRGARSLPRADFRLERTAVPRLTTLLAVALGYSPGGSPSARRLQRPDATIAYGAHPLQQLDFYSAGSGERSLLAFLHGGAWQFGDKARRLSDVKAPFARGEGWHFAALNFRLVPEVGIAEMAHDAAQGVAALVARAAELGIDPRRVVLMGHSSGAHLAALLGTDPHYLGEAGLPLGSLAGVIANDGPAYDAREPSVRAEWLHRRLIAPALSGRRRAAGRILARGARGDRAQRRRVPDPPRRARPRRTARRTARGCAARGGHPGRALPLPRQRRVGARHAEPQVRRAGAGGDRSSPALAARAGSRAAAPARRRARA